MSLTFNPWKFKRKTLFYWSENKLVYVKGSGWGEGLTKRGSFESGFYHDYGHGYMSGLLHLQKLIEMYGEKSEFYYM